MTLIACVRTERGAIDSDNSCIAVRGCGNTTGEQQPTTVHGCELRNRCTDTVNISGSPFRDDISEFVS